MKYSLSDSDLKKVNGGVNIDSYLKCPKCGETIYITMEQFLNSNVLYCPICGLRLELDHIKK